MSAERVSDNAPQAPIREVGRPSVAETPRGMLPTERRPRSTRMKSGRLWGIATALLSVGLIVPLVLVLVPLQSTNQTTQRIAAYSIQVPKSGWGMQPLIARFADLCYSGSLSSGFVGNQTFWLTWQTSGNLVPDFVVLHGSFPIATLFNSSGTSSGGFAQSGPQEIDYFCTGNIELSAYSNVSLTIVVQVGLDYIHSVTVPLV